MTEEVENIEQKLEKVYHRSKESAYYIHGIVMHEGEANSGHFYSYIKDHCEDKWYKFNDHLVSEAGSEEEVLSEAFGNVKPKASAYLVIYATKKG